MTVIQMQGIHHITLVGSNREATIEFYEGVLGMPLIFTQISTCRRRNTSTLTRAMVAC
jgi:hypothetical protein